MALKDINFSNAYVSNEGAWLSGVPNTMDPIPAPEECREEVISLRMSCEKLIAENPGIEDFCIKHCGLSFRGAVMETIDETVYVLRRLSERIKPFKELGIPAPIIEMMLKQGITGLFVISGAFDQGKTTTASSFVAERLQKFGGVAVTIEEPPEMPLHGRHGEGICYQTPVGKGGFGHACRQAARWAPSIIFLGEVRDQETAIEALKASINGKLVICTAHADNAPMAIERMYNLANGEGANSEDVLSMLATGLTAVLHQRLEAHPKGRSLMVEPLFLMDEEAAGTRSIIRQRKFDQLKSIIQLQKNRMIRGGSSAAK